MFGEFGAFGVGILQRLVKVSVMGGVSGGVVDGSHFMLSVGSYREVEERVQGTRAD